MQSTPDYIANFLARFPVSQTVVLYYGLPENAPESAKLIIIPAFANFEITALPSLPIAQIDNTPILYGDSKIDRQNGKLFIHADIIASSFFLLSRYEELLKPESRDQYGRILAKDSIIFKQGFFNRPLVDEYGFLLRGWLREIGVALPDDKPGFSKIFLTHDLDEPFRFARLFSVGKQYIKNLLRYHYSDHPLKKYLNTKYDEYNTFHRIIGIDNNFRGLFHKAPVEVIYFLITVGTLFNLEYYNVSSRKIKQLIELLKSSGAKFGLHISNEAGKKPGLIRHEANRFKDLIKHEGLASRHHYLQWREPEDVSLMEDAGITDDFTLAYADCVGFRVGTCRPYLFINPKTKELTNVIIHPLTIMECTLDHKEYMGLDYESALKTCKELICQVYKHNGELILLWHNTEFLGKNYQEELFKNILDYVADLAQ